MNKYERDKRLLEPQDDRHIARRKKKTGKWCKGKVGTPHTSKWVVSKTYTIRDRRWFDKVCETCGKKLDMWLENDKWWKRPKPDDLNLDDFK